MPQNAPFTRSPTLTPLPDSVTRDITNKGLSLSFTATKIGTFRWYCSLPCDKGQGYWAMANSKKGIARDGYMGGYITVTA